MNDVFEAIGFLSLRTNEESLDEDENYYESLPKIHVISMTQNSSVFDSMLSSQKGKSMFTSNFYSCFLGIPYSRINIISSIFSDSFFSNTLNIRDELWIILTDLLLGDTLAADYVICHLISSVWVSWFLTYLKFVFSVDQLFCINPYFLLFFLVNCRIIIHFSPLFLLRVFRLYCPLYFFLLISFFVHRSLLHFFLLPRLSCKSWLFVLLKF